MNREEIEAKAKELFSDKEYVESLVALEDPKDVQKSLSARGLEISESEILQLRTMIMKSESGELQDEDLEGVSGGSVGAVIGAVLFVAEVAAAVGIQIKVAIRQRW